MAIGLNHLTEGRTQSFAATAQSWSSEGLWKGLGRVLSTAPLHWSTRQNRPSSSPPHLPSLEGVGAWEGKAQHLLEAFPCPTTPYHMAVAACGACAMSRPPSTARMWHIPLPPEALASCKDWCSLTCPKKRKGSRNVRPLHIQDWKPSAKDKGFCEALEWAGGEGMEPSSSRGGGQGGSVPTLCLAEGILPFQPHCGHWQGGHWQGLLIQHRPLGSSGAGPQLLPSLSQGPGR